ncbi:hypothetical protein Tco_1144582 [Tanacetum coccineum]
MCIDSDILRHDQKCKNMKRSQDMQLIQKLRDDQKRMKKVFEVMSGRNIVTNSRVTPSWREIVSLTFSEAGVLHCMTRSSTKELFMPFKDPKREFRSSRKLLKKLSFDESRSPKFNLFFDLEEYSKEEVADTMAETMEQYMRKTQAYYGSRIASFKIDDKDHFELKGQFLKELRDNTLCGSDQEDTNEHIEKVLEIVDLFNIPNITQDQVMLRALPMSLTGAASHWLRNKPSGSITT